MQLIWTSTPDIPNQTPLPLMSKQLPNASTIPLMYIIIRLLSGCQSAILSPNKRLGQRTPWIALGIAVVKGIFAYAGMFARRAPGALLFYKPSRLQPQIYPLVEKPPK